MPWENDVKVIKVTNDLKDFKVLNAFVISC